MTASFNKSVLFTPNMSASRGFVKGYRSTALNNYSVDVIDFDNEIISFDVEAHSESEASAIAESKAEAQGVQVSYINVYAMQ